MTILVTGGCGFIGANFIIEYMGQNAGPVVNIDNMTYSANPKNLLSLAHNPQYIFYQHDINAYDAILAIMQRHKISAVVHFAAESHVDRSIVSPGDFIHTNINGTFQLLRAALEYYKTAGAGFRFVHVSTDEVFGSLGPDDPAFCETTPYQPSSPYSASKAASDHMVRAYFHTYNLPVLITNCSNNYGYFQFPEKLIPLMIHRALADKPLPIYGDGMNIRDWLFVTDHCQAIMRVLQHGQVGETYCVGGNNERNNIAVVDYICEVMDELQPRRDGLSYKTLKSFVPDRLGHDRRYAINSQKIQRQLGWQPQTNFRDGLRKTIGWYLQNPSHFTHQ